jgi:hypothetical protein
LKKQCKAHILYTYLELSDGETGYFVNDESETIIREIVLIIYLLELKREAGDLLVKCI